MSMKVCFTIPGVPALHIKERKKCWYIPVPVDRFPPPENPRWLDGDDLSREVMNDLSVLATIDYVASGMKSPTSQQRLTETVKSIVGELNIPKELHVEIEEAPRA